MTLRVSTKFMMRTCTCQEICEDTLVISIMLCYMYVTMPNEEKGRSDTVWFLWMECKSHQLITQLMILICYYEVSAACLRVYMKRENAGSWNSGLEKEQILKDYSAQLQKS